MAGKMELYKAVKYYVEEYFGDHGRSLPEMWAMVNGKKGWPKSSAAFWKDDCLATYEYDHSPHHWIKDMDTIVASKLSKRFSREKASQLFDKYMQEVK